MSPTITTDGVGCQKGVVVGGSDFYQPNVTFRREKKKSYIKTERPGYISTFPHVFTTEIKKKRHKGTHKGGKQLVL